MKVQNESVEEILSLDELLAEIRGKKSEFGIAHTLGDYELFKPCRPSALWFRLCQEAGSPDKQSTAIPEPREIWLDLEDLLQPLNDAVFASLIRWDPMPMPESKSWLHAGLLLAKLLRDKQDSASGKVTQEERLGIGKIAVDFGLSYAALRDLYAEYRDTPRVPLRERTIGLPLYFKNKDKGVMGELHLALMPDGEGSLYPAHSLAFVEFREDFLQAIELARQSLTSLRTGIPTNRDLRWEVRIRETQRIPKRLEGNSCGGAFALGMMALLMGSDAED